MLVASTLLTLALAALAPGGEPDDAQRVEMRAAPASDRTTASAVVDQLDGGDVLRIRVTDGPEQAAGVVRQCGRAPTSNCVNSFPVQFDAAGEARFQYQLDDLDGRCGATSGCAIVVTDTSGEYVAVAATIFGAAAPPPPSVTVSPGGPYRPGETVDVDVAGALPGVRVDVAYCTPGCGETVSSTADQAGATSSEVTLGERCRDCHLFVTAGIHATSIPVEFEPAGYDPARLAGGLTAAALLLVVAWRIIVTVDWRPPSEADAPELDAPDRS